MAIGLSFLNVSSLFSLFLRRPIILLTGICTRVVFASAPLRLARCTTTHPAFSRNQLWPRFLSGPTARSDPKNLKVSGPRVAAKR